VSDSPNAAAAAPEPLVVTLDVGTSSVRTLVFDARGRALEGFGTQIPYHLTTTADGGAEVDADHLAGLAEQALSHIHGQLAAAGLAPAAVASCTFWHNVLGVGADDRPTTPILHLFDTRSRDAARDLARRIDPRALHARTGCVLHPSYLPAKLLWLSQTQAAAFLATRRWMSFGEYLFLRLFGRPVASTSMVSGSGLWDQNENDYDADLLKVLPIERDQLASVSEMDQPATSLRSPYLGQWPQFSRVQWFPALGDGACNNLGSGCSSRDRFALMVGTSGALRAVLAESRCEIPEGLWCYRVDRRRFVLGGALSNGGNVFQWASETLRLPPPAEIEAALSKMPPAGHGLTILPFLAGERSPRWRADARAAIAGISVHTTALEILQAALESVALEFRLVFKLMAEGLGPPTAVIASGGGLLHSPAWTQMIADALGQPMTICAEREASSRGAALVALERLGAIGDVAELPTDLGKSFQPLPERHTTYEEALRRQQELYLRLLESATG
jgi:gluconokinase